ncbi:hypothetical protein BC332_07047 [Capsicum chinense]|nr:hypothetical protein BC332_07047 [Capsicum chinense]
MRISLSILSFFLLILDQTNGQNSPKISIGSNFTAGDHGYLLSSSGDFAFGFYPVSNTLFLVEIWFNKIEERTLVWSANRDSPAEIGSTISLTNGGQLVLNYANGTVQQIYSGAARGSLKYFTGKFMLEMQYDGKLVLSAYHFADPGYWLSSQDDKGNGEVNLVFNQRTASLYLVKGLATSSNMLIIRLMAEIGLEFGRSLQSHVGLCVFDPSNPNNGCHPEAMINFCANLSAANSKVEVIKDSDIPYQDVGDYEHYPDTDEEGCKKLVMEDCYAMAVTLVNRTCYQKRTPVLNARKTSMTKGSISFIKVPTKSAKGWHIIKKEEINTRAQLTAGLITSSSLAYLFSALALYYHPSPRRLLRRKWKPDSSRIGINFRNFTYKELHEVTNGFSKVLGKGASGKVFFGILNLKDVQVEIAVKRMEKVANQSEKTFMTELKIIGRTHHKNLVKLLRFCIDDNHFLLVYELMKNGALSDFLFKEGMLPTWSHKSEIALGIARGLLYFKDLSRWDCGVSILIQFLDLQ